MSTESDLQPPDKPVGPDSEQTIADTSHDRLGIDGSPLVKKADRIKSRRKKFGFRPLIFGILSGGLAILLCAVCAHYDWFAVIDRSIADKWTRLRGTQTPHPNIILITADESSQEGFDKQWPWPRSIHARLIDNLTAAGAKVIGMDLLFLEDSAADQDAELAAAAQRSGRVVFGSILHQQTTADHETGVAADSVRLIRPLPSLLEHAATGFVNVEASPHGIVRAFPLMHPDFDIEAFDVVILKHYLDAPGKLVPDNNQYRVGPVRIPQPDDGLLEFRYTGGPGTYRRFSYFDVVDPERLDVLNRHVKFDQVVRNSIVLVGCTLLDQKDYFAHPFHDREPIAGLEVHANILQAMIESGYIESAPLHLVYTLLVVLGFSTVMATLWVRTWLAIGITVVVLTGFTAVCYFAYVGMNMTIPWSYPALAIVLGYLVTGSSLRLRIKLAEMWGAYQLLDELGEGGMAIVYRARNKKTRDIVDIHTDVPPADVAQHQQGFPRGCVHGFARADVQLEDIQGHVFPVFRPVGPTVGSGGQHGMAVRLGAELGDFGAGPFDRRSADQLVRLPTAGPDTGFLCLGRFEFRGRLPEIQLEHLHASFWFCRASSSRICANRRASSARLCHWLE